MRRNLVTIGLIALAALSAGSCGKSKTPGTSGAPEGGAPPAAAGASIAWGEDTVWAVAEAPAAGAAKKAVTVQFAPDGNAVMTTEYPGRGAGSDVGWWSVRGDTLAMQLATIDGKTSGTTSSWKIAGTELTPLVYNKEEWGAQGLPLRVRHRAAP